MKKYTIMVATIIIFSTLISLKSDKALTSIEILNLDNDYYPVNDIEPKDDAFHGIQDRLSVEWWYFDAVFNKRYGIHVGLKVFSIGKWGFVRQLINFYNESNVEEKVYVTRPLNHYHISKQFPDIKYKNENLLKFDFEEYNITGNWKYNITFNIKNLKVNLTFENLTKGFKYETKNEGWTVAQPKAYVNGSIEINDKKIKVNGKGYHDHNWNFSIDTALRAKGWYWGKVNSENYTLTWAKIIKNHFADEKNLENFSILNIVNSNYIFIHPDNLTFHAKNYIFQNDKLIPTLLELKIYQDSIKINITMDSVSIQRSPPFFLTIHYYRYFVTINGSIKVNNKIEYINNSIQIIEYIKFV